MSWYYHLESKISFPFQARCVAANAVSPRLAKCRSSSFGNLVEGVAVSKSRAETNPGTSPPKNPFPIEHLKLFRIESYS